MSRIVTYAIKTANPNNQGQGMSRGATFAKARRRKLERLAACFHVMSLRPLPPLPVVVTITRIAPSSGLDPHDGLGAAMKGTIDGVADALGLRSDRDPRVTWRLDQARGKPREYAVRVEIAGKSE